MASYITVTEAVEKAEQKGHPVSDDTIRYWASRKGLGRKVFGHWRIDDDKFERVLSGNPPAGAA